MNDDASIADGGAHRAHAVSASDVTRILGQLAAGDRSQLDRLLEAVYGELRRLAQVHLRDERADHTLAATALVHEAYLKLVDQREVAWRDRAHFFAVASTIIRRILVDHARARNAQKRGGDADRIGLTGLELPEGMGEGLSEGSHGVDLVALDDALRELAELDERQARIVELRFFGGLTIEQIADVLDIGPRTVDRDWRCARTWLFSALSSGGRPEAPSKDPPDADSGSNP